MNLTEKLLDPAQTVAFYGTTPPRLGASIEDVETAAFRLHDRIRLVQPDGLIVYDVQDESARTSEPRPFPFLPTIEPRIYARKLQELTGLPVVSYKYVGHTTTPAWNDWLEETASKYGLHYLSLVGKATSRPSGHGEDTVPAEQSISLPEATRLASVSPAGITIGGVAIAERHSPERSESRKLLKKAADGCSFFVSQAVYSPDASIALLRDYARDCREAGLEPSRIILTFTPCGREKTMAFIKWLGVAIAPETEQAILSAENPLSKSVEICCTALHRILDEIDVHAIPLGLNIESVSINKAEIDASIDLFHALHAVLNERIGN